MNALLQDLEAKSDELLKKYLASPSYESNYKLPGQLCNEFQGSNLYKVSSGSKGNILLLPSLINGPDILDLTPKDSLIKFLANKDYGVYVLDWNQSRAESLDLKEYGAIAASQLEFIGPSIVIGHCLGGLIAVSLASHPLAFKIFAIATPFDFYSYPKTPIPPNCAKTSGFLIYNYFSTRNYADEILKFKSDRQTCQFIEGWLNRVFPFSPKLFAQINHPSFINDFVSAIDAPSTSKLSLIIGEHDRVANACSCLAAKKFFKNCQTYLLPFGHLGLILKAHHNLLSIIES